MLKKADIILAIFLILTGIGLTWFFSTLEETGALVRVTANGKQYGTYALQEDQTIAVKQGNALNQITIKDGQAAMTFSNCHGQDCIRQGKIRDTSQTIVCLPHKVVVEITGDDRGYDGIAQ